MGSARYRHRSKSWCLLDMLMGGHAKARGRGVFFSRNDMRNRASPLIYADDLAAPAYDRDTIVLSFSDRT